MSTPVRLLAFAAALVAVFVLALVGARTVVPADLAQARQGRTGHPTGTNPSNQESGMNHTSPSQTATQTPEQPPTEAPTPSAQHSDTGHGETGHRETSQNPHGGHGSASAADAVRGLAVAQDGYQLESLTAPRQVREEGTLSFRLTDPEGRPVTRYTTSHEKDLHLIVVRSDGSRFRHVHPSTDPFGERAGTWSIPWRWAAAGSYRVFADFVPAATGDPLTLTSTIDVAGDLTPAPPGVDTTESAVDGFTVTLAGAPTAAESSMLTFTVSRGGQRVTTLQPYLGAAGHLVALRSGDLAYLHVHPMDEPAGESGPDVQFMAQAPTPGRYLLYLDFQVDGQVHTATFTTTAG